MTRERVTREIVSCDGPGCQKTVTVEGKDDKGVGWLLLEAIRANDPKQGYRYDFCTYRCLIEFATPRRLI